MMIKKIHTNVRFGILFKTENQWYLVTPPNFNNKVSIINLSETHKTTILWTGTQDKLEKELQTFDDVQYIDKRKMFIERKYVEVGDKFRVNGEIAKIVTLDKNEHNESYYFEVEVTHQDWTENFVDEEFSGTPTIEDMLELIDQVDDKTWELIRD